MVEADSRLKLLPTSIIDILKDLSTLICCPLAYSRSLTQFYPPYLTQNLGYVVNCGVKMMHFCHGRCWQPPQTAPYIHIRHTKSVEHIDMLSMGIQYQPYTVIPTLLGSDCGGSRSLVESKWWDYVMVEADSRLKLLLTSILDMHKVFEHIDMQSIDIW